MCLNDKTCCQNMSLCWYFCKFKIFWRYFYRLFFKFPYISKVNLTVNLNTHFHWLNVKVNCIIGYHNIHSNDTSMFVPSVYHILCKQAEHRSFDNGDESSETFRNTLIYVNKIWKVKQKLIYILFIAFTLGYAFFKPTIEAFFGRRPPNQSDRRQQRNCIWICSVLITFLLGFDETIR